MITIVHLSLRLRCTKKTYLLEYRPIFPLGTWPTRGCSQWGSHTGHNSIWPWLLTPRYKGVFLYFLFMYEVWSLCNTWPWPLILCVLLFLFSISLWSRKSSDWKRWVHKLHQCKQNMPVRNWTLKAFEPPPPPPKKKQSIGIFLFLNVTLSLTPKSISVFLFFCPPFVCVKYAWSFYVENFLRYHITIKCWQV